MSSGRETFDGRPRIGLVGWYGYGNVGDDLLLELIASRLRPRMVFSTRAGQVGDTTISAVADLHHHQDELDLLVIGGGGLLSDRFLARLRLDRLALDYGLLSVGIPHAAWLSGLSGILTGARFVTLRDHLALDLLRESYADVEAWWLPDPAFMLALETPQPRPPSIYLQPSERPTITLIPRDVPQAWLRPADPAESMSLQIEALREIVRTYASAVEFLAVGFEHRDVPLLKQLGCPYQVATPRTAGHLIAASSGIVATRLHAIIIAAATGTRFALIDYQDKMRGVAKLLGCEEQCLRFDELDRLDRFISEWIADPHRRGDTRVAAAYGRLMDRFLGWLSV